MFGLLWLLIVIWERWFLRNSFGKICIIVWVCFYCKIFYCGIVGKIFFCLFGILWSSLFEKMVKLLIIFVLKILSVWSSMIFLVIFGNLWILWSRWWFWLIIRFLIFFIGVWWVLGSLLFMLRRKKGFWFWRSCNVSILFMCWIKFIGGWLAFRVLLNCWVWKGKFCFLRWKSWVLGGNNLG